jgi:hypothetical protein
VGQLSANAHGEVLEAGRVPNCYLGLLLDAAHLGAATLPGSRLSDSVAGLRLGNVTDDGR